LSRILQETSHPTGLKRIFVSHLIELWADEKLKMPAMHYRWSFLDEDRKYLVHEWGTGVPLLSAQQRDETLLASKQKVQGSTPPAKIFLCLG
jgi:hypothetical protein